MPLRQLDFTYAYGFADRVVGAIYNFIPEEQLYVHDHLEEDGTSFATKVSNPCQVTLLHTFIRSINFSDFDYITGHYPEDGAETLAAFLDAAGLNVPAWLTANHVRDHIRELDRLLEEATAIVTNAAFHILFADRRFLFGFQLMVAERVREIQYDDHSDVLKRPGVPKRASYLPPWLKRAVFHRDKGRCQRCFTDLSGILTTNDDLRIDHMLPLAEAGTNDPTNFQLLCDSCNLGKSAQVVFDPQKIYTYW